ncbi:MAG: Protein translocase subunit SecA [Berkelbacteria bacterium GW2011_GWA1_36_9]|uniref:Protein translocase subunit SecA n=1 Tax=Berkelbacteria bacterium GW2011_GWA1_36_9 TaxID=1618331 RepID=A0A0G0FJL5_9BACT|nr:MAG: Protein translocase subunit SecA [Berkelbacteria bacterium GW2011_GWA1_36_9]
MFNFLGKMFGSNEGEVKKLRPIVEKIGSFEESIKKLSNQELKEKTNEFKKELSVGKTLDDILPEAFALVREASKRVLGQRHYDTQLLGGIILHQGKIAEMRTGEGKTLVATLPLYLNALSGKGTHLITVNDYLARRDAAWMGAVYDKLGLTVAAINHEASYIFTPQKQEVDPNNIEYANLLPISRKEAYGADITYGTNNEFGFDYLRDNMVQNLDQMSQRELNFAIVDEVDSILIDEARTPLIISAPAEESATLYRQFALMVPKLKEKEDYEIDEKMHAVTLTDEGMKKVEKMLGLENVYDTRSIQLVHHLEEALIAHALYKKDKDYVVKSGEVIIVDEFTGRMMPGRRYSEGLHQAIEAKEGVEVQRESDTLATISFQNLFRLYKKLAGMTGTAETEAEEFFKIYKLDVVVVPTNKPMIRQDLQDQIYKSEEAKFTAVARDIEKRTEKNQPVLVGTISIERSEKLSRILKRMGVKHEVLNAKHHEREAKIIAQAGRAGAVTVATNMAGRGVDIILGGSPFEKDNFEKVVKAGGLHVLGTERHEARRIDNQLRGRAGRQGDPGSSQFFVCMDDDLMRIFGGDRMRNLMDKLNLPDDVPIEHGLISRSIESAQKKVEGHNFDIRKHLVDYDDVANKHRQAIYTLRRNILEGNKNTHDEILNLMDEETKAKYLEKYNKIGPQTMNQIEQMVYLRSIDTMWIEHLNAMDLLREGIGLRGYGQRDPLVEYKAEAYNLYQRLVGSINSQVVEILLKAEIRSEPKGQSPVALETVPAVPRNLQMRGADETLAAGTFSGATDTTPQVPTIEQQPMRQLSSQSKGVEVTVRTKSSGSSENQQSSSTATYLHVGRNDPCPCGSGKKYKKCHGK